MKKKWDDEKLKVSVTKSHSYRQVLLLLGLIPAGGNYLQVQRRVHELKLSTSHFTGKGWRIGTTVPTTKAKSIDVLLVNKSYYQSYKLKCRLFLENIKKPECEICGWSKKSADGRIPVELDHINGDKYDNRIKNLRILCPNCHSLQITHRGKNKMGQWRNW